MNGWCGLVKKCNVLIFVWFLEDVIFIYKEFNKMLD